MGLILAERSLVVRRTPEVASRVPAHLPMGITVLPVEEPHPQASTEARDRPRCRTARPVPEARNFRNAPSARHQEWARNPTRTRPARIPVERHRHRLAAALQLAATGASSRSLRTAAAPPLLRKAAATGTVPLPAPATRADQPHRTPVPMGAAAQALRGRSSICGNRSCSRVPPALTAATEAIAPRQAMAALAAGRATVALAAVLGPRPGTAGTQGGAATPRVPVAPEVATAAVDAAHPVPAAGTPLAVIPPVEAIPAAEATPVAAITKDCSRLELQGDRASNRERYEGLM